MGSYQPTKYDDNDVLLFAFNSIHDKDENKNKGNDDNNTAVHGVNVLTRKYIFNIHL